MTFIKESMLAGARRRAAQELRGKATPNEVAWLHDHPILWHRVLRAMVKEVRVHNEKDWAELTSMRGDEERTGQPRPEYVEARAVYAKTKQARLHFATRAKQRMAEVRVLCGHRPVDLMLQGDLALAFSDIKYALDSNDPAEARRIADDWMTQLAAPVDTDPILKEDWRDGE